MKFENSIFENEYTVEFTNTGFYNEMTNKSILLFMENLAEEHSNYCHFTFTDLQKYKLTWIILNWRLKVFSRPKSGDKIIVQTYGRDIKKFFVYRDLIMLNEKREKVAVATSIWALVNYETGKLEIPPAEMEEKYHGFRRDLSVFDKEEKIRSIIPKGNPENIVNYKVRRSDLDLNRHVHNLNYLDFAYEALPEKIWEGKELNNVQITYKREIKLGDVIKIEYFREDNKNTIVIKNEDGTKVHSIIDLW